MNVQRNIKARSRNNCRVNAVLHTVTEGNST